MEPLPRQAKPVQKILYSRKEAAELLSVSIVTIDMLISRKMLDSRRIGSKRLIPHNALVAFSQKNLPELWPAKTSTGGRTWSAGTSDRGKQLRLPFGEKKARPEPDEREAAREAS